MRNKNAKVPDPHKIHSCPGSAEHVLYKGVVLKDGTIDLRKCGTENIKDKIQSFKELTDIEYIRKRLALGDVSVLNQVEAFYGDYSEVPTTKQEVLQMFIDGQKAFMSLDVDTRNKFDNDFNKWFAQAGTEEWFKRMNIELKGEQVDNPVEEVKNESES